MKRNSILLAALLLLSGGALRAQDGPWSLSDCIAYALDHNLTVKQGELTVEQREVELSTAKGRRLPAFSASASENLSFGRGLTADNTYSNSNTTSTSFSLGGDLPIFQGFDITNGIKLGKLNLAAATADLEKARDDIRVAVAQAYVQILYNQELLRVAREQSAHDAQLLEQIRERLSAGKVSAAEVSAQQATLAQSRQSEIQAEGNLRISVLELTQLLELPSPEGFAIVTPEVGDPSQILLMRPEAIYEEAVAVKPSVESARLNVDYAELGIARAKGAYLPSIRLPAVRRAAEEQLQPVCGRVDERPHLPALQHPQQRAERRADPQGPADPVREREESALQGDPAGLLQRRDGAGALCGQPRERGERPRAL